MPVYEYVCNACSQEFEKLILGKADVIDCPHCQGTDLTKKVSAVSFTSGGKFKSSVAGSGCSGCTASPGKCSSCK